MALKASIAIKSVKAVLDKPIDARLGLVKSILPTVENGAVKITEPLCRALIKALTTVVRCPDVTPEQLALAVQCRARVDSFDPRNPENKKVRVAEQSSLKPKVEAPTPPVTDGFESEFLNINEAIARVEIKYGNAQPRYTDWENQKVLQVFLGDGVPINEHSCRQAWLALAYEFKARGGSYERKFETVFPPQAEWVKTAICSVGNQNKFQIGTPPPSCLTIMEELGF